MAVLGGLRFSGSPFLVSAENSRNRDSEPMLLLIAEFVGFCYDSVGNFGSPKKRKLACFDVKMIVNAMQRVHNL